MTKFIRLTSIGYRKAILVNVDYISSVKYNGTNYYVRENGCEVGVEESIQQIEAALIEVGVVTKKVEK